MLKNVEDLGKPHQKNEGTIGTMHTMHTLKVSLKHVSWDLWL